mgnify:CR=1 FL=1
MENQCSEGDQSATPSDSEESSESDKEFEKVSHSNGVVLYVYNTETQLIRKTRIRP